MIFFVFDLDGIILIAKFVACRFANTYYSGNLLAWMYNYLFLLKRLLTIELTNNKRIMIKKLFLAISLLGGVYAQSLASPDVGVLPPVPKPVSVTSEFPASVVTNSVGPEDSSIVKNGLNDEQVAEKVRNEAELHDITIDAGNLIVKPGKLAVVPRKGDLICSGNFPTMSAKQRASHLKGAIYSTYGYISKDYSAMNSDYEYNALRISRKNGEFFVSNIYGLDTLSVCTIDETAGTITIPAQKIGYTSTYGDIWIMPIEWDGNHGTAKRNGNLVGTFNADGSISFGGWGILVYEGPYAGSAFNYYYGSEAIPSNATAEVVATSGTEINVSLVEQPYSNLVSIYNLAGNGNPVNGRVDKSGNITITPQKMLSLNLYGDFFIYQYDATNNKVNTQGSIIATYSDGVLTIPPYAIVAKASTNVAWMKASGGAKVTCRDFTMQVPEPMEVKFDGNGTESSPYLIKNGEDMLALSQSVSDGHTYRGQYFRVANDFSMKNGSRAYQAAGDNYSRFAGTFDGNGKTISDLEINGMGFNYQGVFGYVDTVATIKDITFDKLKVYGTGARMGGICGELSGTLSNVKIINGVLDSKGDMLGGMAGYSQGIVDRCSYSGSIRGGNYVGGMVAFNLYRITNCWSDAIIYPTGSDNMGVNSVGGIVGTHYSATRLPGRATVSECWFGGIIDDQYGYSKTAGIAAYLTNAVVERCLNVGIISGSNANNNATPDDYDSSLTGTYVYDNATGGIAGTLTTNSEIVDCVNAGTILKSKISNRAAGIAGYISVGYTNNAPSGVSTITNCINTGYINSSPNDDRERRGIWGATWVKYGYNIGEMAVKNCWSDNQATGLLDTLYGKQTLELTTASLLPDFSSSIWTAQANRYLTLKAFENTQVGALATANHVMADGESVKKFKGPGHLYGDSGVDFFVYYNKEYVKSYDAISLADGVTTAGTIYDNVLMIARTTDGTKMKYMPVNVVPNTYEGRGTKDNPYILRTVADFQRLNSGITEAYQPHNFDYFRLANDIDFALGDQFNGFAAGSITDVTEFGGTFDGDGHTISGLKVKGDIINPTTGQALVGAYPYAGLFHVLNKYATVKNLALAANCQIAGHQFTGSFAGYCAGRIENCRNYADVTNLTTAAGGIVGGLTRTGVVSGCYNSGNVTNGYIVAGGIAGYNLGRIELSQNDGNVAGKVLSVLNEDVANFVQYGGIAGYANSGITDRCVNTGNVSAATKVGGLNGSHGASDVLGGMYNSINTGVVESIISSTNLGGISGATENGTTVGTATGLYFDAQLTTAGAVANTNVEGTTAATTSTLVSGTPLEGLSNEIFSFTANSYPVLKAFASENLALAKRAAYIIMGGNQNRNNITSEATLSSNEKLSWKLAIGTAFNVNGNRLEITNTTGGAVQDTLYALWVGKVIKSITIGNVPSVFTGAGTEADPFQITSVADLAKLASVVNENGLEYKGSFFKVMNDITYTPDDTFIPISMPSGSMKFQGVFDGAGHTIAGYKYEGALNYTGFFGTLGEDAVVKNLTIAGEMAGNMYTGGLAGKVYGRIENCTNASTVTSSVSYAGGLAAYMYAGSSMLNCVNKGKVGETKTSTGSNTPTLSGGLVAFMDNGSVMDSCCNIVDRNVRSTAGGLASKSGGIIRNSYNTGNITSASTGGGLVGTSEKTLKLYNCWNTGEVSTEGTSANIGGLVGSSTAVSTVEVINCWNSGDVKGASSVGGLFGTYPTGAQMRNCYNTGNVTGTSTNVGGLVGTGNGSVNYPSLISNCWNEGKVTSPKANLGGLTGNIANGLLVDSCVNYGTVEMNATAAAGSVGGCVGNLAGEIRNCWNAGEVKSTSYGIGGVAGQMTAATSRIYYCVNVGNVKSTGAYGNTGAKPIYGNAAGIAGSSIKGAAVIDHSANFGTITAPDMVAGIIGAACKGDTILNSFNAGAVIATASAPTCRDNMVLFYQTTSTSTNGTADNVVTNALYYDSDINTQPGLNAALSTPLSTRNMLDLKIDGFENHPYCYPMIAHLSHASEINLYSVGILPEKENETLTGVTGKLCIGQADHLKWKGTSHFRFCDGGIVETLEKGDGQITISTDSENNMLSRTIDVKIEKPSSGIDGINAEAGIESVDYYDLTGHRIKNAAKGDVVIRITTFTNGTRATEKVVIR